MKAKHDLSISCGGAEPVRYAKGGTIKPEHREMARRLQPAEPEPEIPAKPAAKEAKK